MIVSESGRRGAQALLLVPACLLLLLLPPPASAHAKLERSSPKSNESLAHPPRLVEL